MNGAIPPLPQYAFMAWCSVEAQGQLYLYLLQIKSNFRDFLMAIGNISVVLRLKKSLTIAFQE
jgi:hypothetical protein